MATILEPVNPGFPAVYQWDIDDDVIGGPEGQATLPIKQLVERDGNLKNKIGQEIEDREDGDAALQQQIGSMKGRGGYLTANDFGDFGDMTPEDVQEALTGYALAQIHQTDPVEIWNGTHVKNLFDSHVWALTNTQDTDPPIFEWADDGFDSIKQGDNDGVLGVVSGGHGFDDVFIDPQGKMHIPSLKAFKADEIEGYGRDLRLVFGITSIDPAVYIPQIMAEIRRRCNNNGEIDASGIPDFTGIMIGDYIDGLDLSGVIAAPGGTAPQTWNDTYKNNRIVVSGFNTFKGSGDTETTKNHILFTFRNAICTGYMNSSNDNSGGYPATLMRAWLEGTFGDGAGSFAAKLKTALGGSVNYLLTFRQLLSNKADSFEWVNTTVFLPSEQNIFGNAVWSEAKYGDGLCIHFPIYQKASTYRVKRYNGVRRWWWDSSPDAASPLYFANVDNLGNAYHGAATSNYDGGISPVFCAY